MSMSLLSFVFVFAALTILIYYMLPSSEYRMRNQNELVVKSLIVFGVLLSLVVFSVFFLLLDNVTLVTGSLKVSELGDAIAGFSTFLAFAWLIITVFIQSIELKNQHREMAALSQSTGDQAISLRNTLRFQALQYIDDKQADISAFITRRTEIVANLVVEFHQRHGVVVSPVDFHRAPKSGMEYAVSILCKTSLLESPLCTKEVFALREDFTRDDFLFVMDVHHTISEVLDVALPIQKMSEEVSANDEFRSWTISAEFAWFYEHHQRIFQLSKAMEEAIVEGGGSGFSRQQRQWIAALSANHD